MARCCGPLSVDFVVSLRRGNLICFLSRFLMVGTLTTFYSLYVLFHTEDLYRLVLSDPVRCVFFGFIFLSKR